MQMINIELPAKRISYPEPHQVQPARVALQAPAPTPQMRLPVISSGHKLYWWGGAMSICNEPNASQCRIASINHFRIRTFARKQV